MTPEGQKPSQGLCLTKLPRAMYSQPIVHKALSWGILRKSACVLTEITIRKSQELLFCRGVMALSPVELSGGRYIGTLLGSVMGNLLPYIVPNCESRSGDSQTTYKWIMYQLRDILTASLEKRVNKRSHSST
jgi:hypothetical protein